MRHQVLALFLGSILLAAGAATSCKEDEPPPQVGGTTSSSSTSSGGVSSDPRRDAEADADAPDGDAEAGPDTSSDGGACHALAQQGAIVQQITSAALAPAATGGTIMPGTYVLTASKLHGSGLSDGEVLGTVGRITIQIEGGTMRAISSNADDVDKKSGTFTAVVADKSFAFTPTCQDGPPSSRVYVGSSAGTKYSATPSTLTLLVPISVGPVLENVYTLR